MHRNLVKVQESMIQCVADVLEIAEIRNMKPLVITALKISEKPLTSEEIQARTKLDPAAVKEILDDLEEKGIIIKDGNQCFDFADRAGHRFMETLHSKARAVMQRVKSHLDNSRKLMAEGKGEFDSYDSLMARFLGEKLHKAEMIAQILKRKIFFFDFLESNRGEGDSVKRIPVE